MPALLLGTLVAIANVTAQTTTTILCDRDNTLYEDATGSLSNGAGGAVFVGKNGGGAIRRTLMHFDIAGAVPAGARILAARLNFFISPNLTSGQTATAHRVLQDWGEGTSIASGNGGAGTAATANDATWLFSFYPTTSWATPGGDFDPTPSFSTPLYLNSNLTPSTSAATADAQFWLDQPTQNFGWMLRSNETASSTANRIASRESGGPVLPQLSITYLLPGTSGWHGSGCPMAFGNYGFTFNGTPIGGTTIGMEQSNGPPGALSAHLFALELDFLGTPITSGCTLHLPLATLVNGPAVVLDPSGTATTPFALPTGFPGFVIACQTIAIDNSNPFGFVISNAGLICLQ